MAGATSLVFSGGLSYREVESSATTVEYIRGSDYGGGIGGILYTLRDLDSGGEINDPRYKHYNSRGDIVAETDGSGSLTYQAAYEAFGRHGDSPGTEDNGTTLDRQQGNTKDEDPTGLLNEGMRYRDLESGVFLTRDPAGFVDGPNLYCYVVQNPWTKFDPLGLQGKEGEFSDKETSAPENKKSNSEKPQDSANKPEASANEKYFAQKKDMSCCVACTRNVILSETGRDPGERLLRQYIFYEEQDYDVAQGKSPRAKHDWNKSGTSPEYAKPVLSKFGIDSEVVNYQKSNAIDTVTSVMDKNGGPVIAIVVGNRGARHYVVIESYDKKPTGEITFNVIDPANVDPKNEFHVLPKTVLASEFAESVANQPRSILSVKRPSK